MLTHYISVHFMPVFPLKSEILKDNGEDAYVIGEIIKSEDGVTFR